MSLWLSARTLPATVQCKGPDVSVSSVHSQRFEVFYDGDCPLCLREINMLRRWDRWRVIRFTDIAAADFSAADLGTTQDALMAEIHGRLPDGQWVTGVEVFRQLYAAVGLGPLVWLTRLPVITQVLNAGYRLFARNRLRLTGRCTKDSCPVPAKPARDIAS